MKKATAPRLCSDAALLGFLGLVCAPLLLAAASGPTAITPSTPIATPRDQAYPGELQIMVNASDTERRIMHVHETLSGISPSTVLFYPKWLPGNHAPEGPIDRVAGLRITARGADVGWTRDPVDVYAFHLHAPPGTKLVEIDFDYLSPTSERVGPVEMSRNLVILEWNNVVLYPAGYFVRRIPVHATVILPADFQMGTALEPSSTTGARTEFKQVDLERLVDSPVYAGRYMSRLDLDPGAAASVHLDLFADRPSSLVVKPEQLEAHRNLVKQAYALYASHHYDHYDFLYSLSNEVEHNGLEHHQSSEDGADSEAFTAWDKWAFDRDLLPHEFTHSWNGKFRRPADLWTPNYDVPMQNSLLWVYEGQTEYWGKVLAARSGLQTPQEYLDALALTAAEYENEAGREWRPLRDTTNGEIMNARRPLSWRSWQRAEDYYDEGNLIWLDADTLIREKTNGKHSLDDFARVFFGIDNGSFTTVTYTFEDIVKALNTVMPYDWAAFLHARVDSVAKLAPLDGVRRGGYRLVYSDAPSDLLKMVDESLKRLTLTYSIGFQVDAKDNTLRSVLWNSPAFKAGLTEGSKIFAVNGVAYSGDILTDAIRSATKTHVPIEMIIQTDDRFREVKIDYQGGLRYPHLERDPAVPALLDDILAATK